MKFKTKEEVEEYFSGDRIECLICGRWLRAVGGKHLKVHGISVDEYKNYYGLPWGRGLVCSETAEKQRAALEARIEKGDIKLTPLTPELAWKAQHAPKRKPPLYHILYLNEIAKDGYDIIMAHAEERASNIDWDIILEAMEEQGVALRSVKIERDKPTSYDLARKMNNDSIFAQKYNDIVNNNKILNIFKNEVIQLTSEGLSQEEISNKLGISETHIGRMRKLYIKNWGNKQRHNHA